MRRLLHKFSFDKDKWIIKIWIWNKCINRGKKIRRLQNIITQRNNLRARLGSNGSCSLTIFIARTEVGPYPACTLCLLNLRITGVSPCAADGLTDVCLE